MQAPTNVPIAKKMGGGGGSYLKTRPSNFQRVFLGCHTYTNNHFKFQSMFSAKGILIKQFTGKLDHGPKKTASASN
jgi:hypothetical protein